MLTLPDHKTLQCAILTLICAYIIGYIYSTIHAKILHVAYKSVWCKGKAASNFRYIETFINIHCQESARYPVVFPFTKKRLKSGEVGLKETVTPNSVTPIVYVQSPSCTLGIVFWRGESSFPGNCRMPTQRRQRKGKAEKEGNRNKNWKKDPPMFSLVFFIGLFWYRERWLLPTCDWVPRRLVCVCVCVLPVCMFFYVCLSLSVVWCVSVCICWMELQCNVSGTNEAVMKAFQPCFHYPESW